MRTKLLTLALFGIMSLSFVACSEEEIAPVNDPTVEETTHGNDREGGDQAIEK